MDSNMEMEQITNHLEKRGFSRAQVTGQHVEVLLKNKGSDAYAVVAVDCRFFSDITMEQYENMLRGIRSSLYCFAFDEVHILSLLCTPDPGSVKQLLDGFGEHWIVDLSENRLLIYEHQIASFLDAKEIIEEALLYQDEEMMEQVAKIKTYRKIWKDTYVTFLLAMINVIVFMVTVLFGNVEDASYMSKIGGLAMDQVGHGFWEYRILTSTFLHFGIDHLANNMFMLIVMGLYLEKYMSKWKYFTIYLGSGIVGSIVSIYYYIYAHQQNAVCAGASGAIFGLTGALLWVILRHQGRLEQITWKHIAFLVFMNVYIGMHDTSVGNAAHIGGLIGGFFICMFLYTKDKVERNKEEEAS